MKCPKCYNEIQKNSKICPICGNIFATYFEEIKLTPKQKIKLLAHKILFPTVIIIMIIMIIIYIIIKHQTKMNYITDVSDLTKDEAYYINDLYISDSRHYKYLLNKKEKQIYDEILNAIINHQENIKIDLNEYEITQSKFITQTIRKIKDVLSMDHPELIELAFISQKIDENIASITMHYVFNKEEYKEIEKLMKETIENIKEETKSLEEYKKVKYVYEYLYNTEKTNNIESYSAYGCLILKQCNDEGYAKTSQIIFNNLKINSLISIGLINNKHHELNIVKVENKYYYYDQSLSKKNSKISYKGLLFKDKNYKIYYKKLMPTINGKKYLNK